jgi:hypothetical protein
VHLGYVAVSTSLGYPFSSHFTILNIQLPYAGITQSQVLRV